jgi:hypothetical protein
MPDVVPAVQIVEEQDKIFDNVKGKTAVNDEPDDVFGMFSDVEAVVPENARDGHHRNNQTANLKGQLDAVLVIRNVDADLPVVFVVVP